MPKTVIVGTNHAGIAAANTLLDNFPDQEVIMIDQAKVLSYLGCGSALWIGRQIPDYHGLFYAQAEDFEKKGAKIYMETTVESISFYNRKVFCKDKNDRELIFDYDSLILATGSTPIVPNIPGADLEGIYYLKTFENGQQVDEVLLDDNIKTVAVVGAGYIGIEMAEAIKRRNKHVLLFDVQDTVLASYYDESFSIEMQRNLEKHGIELHLNESVIEYEGGDIQESLLNCIERFAHQDKNDVDASEIKNALLKQQKHVHKLKSDHGEYKVDLVIHALGFRPNTILGSEYIELSPQKAYLVDEHQKTNKSNVYAVGDCTTIYSNALNQTTYIALATNAVRSGIVAGYNVGGKAIVSPGVQGSNGISIFGLNMVSTGLTLQAAQKNGFNATTTDFEDLQRPVFMEKNNQVKIRIVYDKDSRRILGTQMCSYEDISMGIHMFSLAIEQQLTIDNIALLDIFFLPHFNQPYNYITMAALGADD